MTKFEYKKIHYDQNFDMIKQINVQGLLGWRFHSMGQEVSPVKSLSGNPQVTIVLIFERSYEVQIVGEA